MADKKRDRQMQAKKRMEFNISYEMLAPLEIRVIILYALSL